MIKDVKKETQNKTKLKGLSLEKRRENYLSERPIWLVSGSPMSWS